MDTKFKETKIGRIPEEWDAVQISKLGKVVTGSTPSTSVKEYWGKDVPFVTPTDIVNSKTLPHVERYLSYKGTTVSRMIPPNSICVTCIASIGKICITKTPSVTNQQINSILPDEKFDTEYLYYVIVHNRERLNALAGFTTVPIVKKSSFEKFLVALPPLPEQHKIAEIITTVDEAIEKTDTIIKETQQLKKGLMQKLFIEGIGHTRFRETKIGQIPEEWDTATLGEVLTNIQSGVSRNLSIIDIGVPVIRSTNIKDNRLVLDDLRYWFWDDTQGVDLRNYILDRGDILINFINSVAQIGKCCIFSGQPRDFIFTTNIFRAKSNDELISNIYFLMFSETEAYQSQISSITKPAVNQASFTHGDFRKIKIPLPKKQEQDKIVNILSGVDAKIETEQAYKTELQRLKKGLMQVLLTGQVRVKI